MPLPPLGGVGPCCEILKSDDCGQPGARRADAHALVRTRNYVTSEEAAFPGMFSGTGSSASCILSLLGSFERSRFVD